MCGHGINSINKYILFFLLLYQRCEYIRQAIFSDTRLNGRHFEHKKSKVELSYLKHFFGYTIMITNCKGVTGYSES